MAQCSHCLHRPMSWALSFCRAIPHTHQWYQKAQSRGHSSRFSIITPQHHQPAMIVTGCIHHKQPPKALGHHTWGFLFARSPNQPSASDRTPKDSISARPYLRAPQTPLLSELAHVSTQRQTQLWVLGANAQNVDCRRTLALPPGGV